MIGKTKRKELARLAGLAHDRELGLYLSELEVHFRDWREGRIGPSELSDFIHEFHDGSARAVFKTYSLLKRDQLVARAVGIGLLKENEVAEEIRQSLAGLIDHYREDYQIDQDDPLSQLREKAESANWMDAPQKCVRVQDIGNRILSRHR